MKRAPISYRRSPWSKEEVASFRQIERDFHVRAFGEELARVNFDMTIEERHRYLDWMRETARKHGVLPSPRAFDFEESKKAGQCASPTKDRALR